MKKETMKKDHVFTILETLLRNSPERSYKRLNPALCSTLHDCIEADLPFLPDTFKRIYYELRGGCWFGDGAGSHHGEDFYTRAVSVNHASACISFENFAERPAVGTRAFCPVMQEAFTVEAGTRIEEYQGRYYAFCCPGCAKKFEAHPETYADPAS